jgi:hypothetical protein
MVIRCGCRAHEDGLPTELFTHLDKAERPCVKRGGGLSAANEENGVVEARNAK